MAGFESADEWVLRHFTQTLQRNQAKPKGFSSRLVFQTVALDSKTPHPGNSKPSNPELAQALAATSAWTARCASQL